ncbi:hypothetical protein ACHAPT_001056 [Fusarium lateritium]
MPSPAALGSYRVSKPSQSWKNRTDHRHGSERGRSYKDVKGERDDSARHNNYGRVSRDNYNYSIKIKSFGDNDRSKNWNGNVVRDRGFNNYIQDRHSRRDRFDNRRYSPARSSRESSRRNSESLRTRSTFSSGYSSRSSTQRPMDATEPSSRRESTYNRDRDDRDSSYYGARQAYHDISRGEAVCGRMRPTDRVRDESELIVGTIISTAIHQQAREDTVSIGEFNKSLSGFGVVYSKYRKLIIVEEWTQHVVCIPLYTYNGLGLAGRESSACEYFDVRDVDDPNPERGDAFSTLFAVRGGEWPRENAFVEGRTVAKLTEKITFYRTGKCSIEGSIVPDSLQALIMPYMNSGTNPMAKMMARSRASNPTSDEQDVKEEGEIDG